MYTHIEHTCARAHTYTDTHLFGCMNACMCVYVCVHTWMYAYVHIDIITKLIDVWFYYTNASKCTHLHAYVNVCITYVYMYACKEFNWLSNHIVMCAVQLALLHTQVRNIVY